MARGTACTVGVRARRKRGTLRVAWGRREVPEGFGTDRDRGAACMQSSASASYQHRNRERDRNRHQSFG